MPIYEYECRACGKTVEAMQRISDPPLEQCPACGGAPVTKVVSRTSFQLKGTGWYASDYKKTSAPSEPAKDAPAVKKAGEKKPESA